MAEKKTSKQLLEESLALLLTGIQLIRHEDEMPPEVLKQYGDGFLKILALITLTAGLDADRIVEIADEMAKRGAEKRGG